MNFEMTARKNQKNVFDALVNEHYRGQNEALYETGNKKSASEKVFQMAGEQKYRCVDPRRRSPVTHRSEQVILLWLLTLIVHLPF